jgi:hypothetical protein
VAKKSFLHIGVIAKVAQQLVPLVKVVVNPSWITLFKAREHFVLDQVYARQLLATIVQGFKKRVGIGVRGHFNFYNYGTINFLQQPKELFTGCGVAILRA